MSGPGPLAGPVLFVGTAAGFSAQVLMHLLARDAPIAAVVVPHTHGPAGPRRELPVTVPGAGISVTDLARDAGLPVETLAADLAAPGLGRLAGYRPAATLVACFPRRIPMAFCRLAAEGCFNLHPSLLPAYRGPAPLFWQFRNGEPRGGITVHRLTGTLDAGPIALQAPYRLADGLTEPRANGDLARLGGELYLELLVRIRRQTLTLQAQDEARATHYGWPEAEDFHLAPTWSARRAYNFMCGTASWGRPFAIDTHAGTLWVHEAVAWFPEGASPAPAGPDTLDLAFAGGVVRVRPVVPG